MEELEILPRDAYLHPISITRAPCTIQWWFSTKRKNIDFGLFYRRAPAAGGYSDDGRIRTPYAARNHRQSSTTVTPIPTPKNPSSASSGQLAEPDNDLAAKQRGGYFKLQDKNVTELIPLKHYESSRSTIKGSWNAAEPGTYILYFDNSFSKNTSKRLSMCVAVKEKATEATEDVPAVVQSGWLMQGWANRWFSLQGGVVRSKVDIEDRIVILRALSDDDFSSWVTAFQNVKDQAAQHPATVTISTDAGFNNSTQLRPPVTCDTADSRHLQLLQASMDDSISQLQRLANNSQALIILIHHLSDHEVAVQQQEQSDRQDSQSQVDTGSAPPTIAHTDSRMSFLSASGSDIFYDTNEVLEVAHEDLKLSPSPKLSPTDAPAFESPVAGKIPAITTNGSPGSTSDGGTPTLDPSITPTSGQDDADSISDSDNDDAFYGGSANHSSTNRNIRMHRDLIRDPDFVEAMVKHRLASPRPSTSEPYPESPLKQDQDTEYTDLDNRPEVTLDRVKDQIVGHEPRTELPAIMCEANNVGKDLTSIAMPLVMNEPINALQALRILARADEMGDSIDRLITLSSKKHRAERKPFNPLLGETYEKVDPHMGFPLYSPNYRFWQDSSGKSKFWGKSMEMIQTSNVHIELLKHGDHFTYGKPSALVRGLITGNRTVDFTGEMRITNQTTGDYCTVHFKEGGMFSSSNDMVECTCTAKGTASFSYFTMCLNELVAATANVHYEEGRLQDAEETKHELEEAQRERKRERDAKGEEWKTKWFEEREDPYSETGRSWQYKGGYWDDRANHTFDPAAKLW
ncbi:hypothetical protein DL89DRAFT_272765 [Linderina pennispora]|uniref:GOLD domain-containing protein n=1 Tax=Linderina pennispora TaxID=61395 RepID=A0A1Y1VRZ0_9FUNG|nr:uncharacterized protein DL89DRAFT_272765 [Linderina pennispora]ORX64062.1 hypothetical protein DL89DRAFT_272765 [Linderina pennispora]